jgi:hypothetical protein
MPEGVGMVLPVAATLTGPKRFSNAGRVSRPVVGSYEFIKM